MAEGKVGFHDKSILDKASINDRKLDQSDPLAQPPTQPFCPQCNSTRLYKDGLRYLADGKFIQRWLCRECGYRFSQQKPLQENLDWQINTPSAYLSKRQVCELDRRVEKLGRNSPTGTSPAGGHNTDRVRLCMATQETRPL